MDDFCSVGAKECFAHCKAQQGEKRQNRPLQGGFGFVALPYADQCIISGFVGNVKDLQGDFLFYFHENLENWGKSKSCPQDVVGVKKGRPIGRPVFLLAAAAVVVAGTVVAAVVTAKSVATAAAEQQNQNNNPPAAITVIAHKKYLHKMIGWRCHSFHGILLRQKGAKGS